MQQTPQSVRLSSPVVISCQIDSKMISEHAQAYLDDDPLLAGCLELFQHEPGGSLQARAENIFKFLPGVRRR